jgi:hypothetical protein
LANLCGVNGLRADAALRPRLSQRESDNGARKVVVTGIWSEKEPECVQLIAILDSLWNEIKFDPTGFGEAMVRV